MRFPLLTRSFGDRSRCARSGNDRRLGHRRPRAVVVIVGLVGGALAVAMAPAHAGGAAAGLTVTARDENPGARAPGGSWSWPVGEPRVVVRGFIPPEHRFGAGHRGLDIAAREGDTVVAPSAGVVLFAGPVAGRSVVTVDHGRGVVSSYDPVEPLVVTGESVAAGGRLGILGPGVAMHCRAGCVHVGVRRDGAYVDPAPFFRPPRRSVLLPLEP
ncbi:murein hydrolase activator EnvC family protein [Labedella populi]|nr:peptidoglycan DD-metalloendopeptidase family protein [Labedella populi]